MKKIENKEICLGDIGTCKGRKNSGIIGEIKFTVIGAIQGDDFILIQINDEQNSQFNIYVGDEGEGPNGGKLAFQDKGKVFSTSGLGYTNGNAAGKYCGFKFNK